MVIYLIGRRKLCLPNKGLDKPFLANKPITSTTVRGNKTQQHQKVSIPMFTSRFLRNAASALVGLSILCVQLKAEPGPYVLQRDVKVVPKQYWQTDAADILRDWVNAQFQIGNFGRLSDDGIELKLAVEWFYEHGKGVQAVHVIYKAGNFAGEFRKTRDDISVVDRAAHLLPKHTDLANLAAQELVRRWQAYKLEAQMRAKGLEGAPSRL
jgi:hypothetical protein